MMVSLIFDLPVWLKLFSLFVVIDPDFQHW
jgi:hypothetical protein